jgi:hypothetical protein
MLPIEEQLPLFMLIIITFSVEVKKELYECGQEQLESF